MGVSEWFSEFCGNLAASDIATIRTRYRAITKRLNQDFWGSDSDITHSLYVGSYGRGTGTQISSDVDMLMRLPWTEHVKYDAYITNGQSALLQAVRNSIQKTYPSTEVGGDGQVVVVSFTYGRQFEVLPGFLHSDGPYTYPDANGGGKWRTTNPRAEIDAIRTRDSACNGNLRRLGRMMRAWKSEWSVPISGMLIDTLAYHFINGWAHRDKSYLYYDYLTRDFLQYLSSQSSTKTYWLAPGSSQYVYRTGVFERKARDSYDIAVEAISKEVAGYNSTAKSKWREVYGTKFPS